jgi:hypothetical protein
MRDLKNVAPWRVLPDFMDEDPVVSFVRRFLLTGTAGRVPVIFRSSA